MKNSIVATLLAVLLVPAVALGTYRALGGTVWIDCLGVRLGLLAPEELAGELAIAARYDHLARVKGILACGAAAEVPSANGFSPLAEAARDGRYATAALLIDRGAAVDGAPAPRTSAPYTPLYLAAERGRDNTVRLLLERGANPNAAATGEAMLGATPLFIAAVRGHEGTIEQLLAAGAVVDKGPAGGEWAGYTPLAAALVGNHLRAAEVLVRQGADVDAELSLGPHAGWSPLWLAISTPNVTLRTVQWIAARSKRLDEGLQHTAPLGMTPLMQAVALGRVDVAEVLLQAGARPETVVRSGPNKGVRVILPREQATVRHLREVFARYGGSLPHAAEP